MSITTKKTIYIDKDLEEITPVFLENRHKDLLLLEKYLQEKNFAEIAVIGHKLAGNAESYGHPELGEIGTKIESFAKMSDSSNIIKLKEQISTYLSTIVIAFK
ncbi:MAG: Hpt domain-containing protein [Oligoflexia bacterium]|nr:Hpt domain-containing protein [Oligoflexia bacterium]MBF0364275.1 Hpt domain-containing protein [Oligoflexia bacterium]